MALFFFCGKRSRTPRRKVECPVGVQYKDRIRSQICPQRCTVSFVKWKRPCFHWRSLLNPFGWPYASVPSKGWQRIGKECTTGIRMGCKTTGALMAQSSISELSWKVNQFIYQISYWSFSIEFHPAFVKVDRCRLISCTWRIGDSLMKVQLYKRDTFSHFYARSLRKREWNGSDYPSPPTKGLRRHWSP